MTSDLGFNIVKIENRIQQAFLQPVKPVKHQAFWSPGILATGKNTNFLTIKAVVEFAISLSFAYHILWAFCSNGLFPLFTVSWSSILFYLFAWLADFLKYLILSRLIPQMLTKYMSVHNHITLYTVLDGFLPFGCYWTSCFGQRSPTIWQW